MTWVKNLLAHYGVNFFRTLAIIAACVVGGEAAARGYPMLAVVVALIATGFFVWSLWEHSTTVRTVQAVKQASSTGAETEVILPDGTRHILGAIPFVAPKGTHFVVRDGKQVLEALPPENGKA